MVRRKIKAMRYLYANPFKARVISYFELERSLCSLYIEFFLGHRMVRLSADDLVAEAVEAFKNNECIEEPPEEPPVLILSPM